MGLEVIVALVANGVGIGAALTATYGAIVAGAIRIGFSLLARSILGGLTQKRPTQQDLKRDLAFPTSRPNKRYVYGEFRAPATVLPYPVIGEYSYACWLINSRESDGSFTIYLDNRELDLEGDPYDFNGPGAVPSDGSVFTGHVSIWIGLGDQTQPPQVFLDEAGYVVDGDELLWKASDKGTGLTMVWAKLRAGDNGQRSERWPSAIPQLEVEGRLSKVWDMRDESQTPDDPSTWQWSQNAYLCGLDLARQNPFRPYDNRNLELTMWAAAADVSDEAVALKNGGSEPRYTVAGVVAFDGSEVETLLQPIIAAGAGRLAWSGGQLGVVPGAPRDTAVQIADSLGGLSFSALRADDEITTELRVTYSPRERGGEPAELVPWAIPGALEQDKGKPSVKTLDLSMVSSATQAQRVRNIAGNQNRLQKQATVVAPPYGIKAVVGSVIDLSLAAPYTKMNGLYEVESMSPFLDPVGKDGFALRCAMSLREYSDSITAWTPATDEEDVTHAVYDGTRDGVASGGPISVVTGDSVNLDTGGGIIARVKFSFSPSTSGGVEGYEVRTRLVGDPFGPSQILGAESVDLAGDVFGYIEGIAGQSYDIEIRALSASGRSDWVTFLGATPVVDIALDTPTEGAAVGGVGEITVSFRTPNDPDFRAIEIHGSDTDDIGAASLIGTAIYTSQNTIVSVTESSLGASVSRYYFARSRGDYASASAFTASVTGTTDP
ncbi:MAG: phage tail protein [Sulfitobacter sp.]